MARMKRVWLRGYIDLPTAIAEAGLDNPEGGYEVVCYVLKTGDGDSMGDIDLNVCSSPFQHKPAPRRARRA